jgi:crotonobetainyl-CoA:carnitine CoA-transferase CaiB-like acyl-CoA transferase
VRFDGRTREVRRSPPRLGEHTRGLLLEAGYSAEAIDALVASGAAREFKAAGR